MQKYHKNKGIISLIFLLVVGFFVLGLATTTTTRTILEIKKNRNALSGDQSFYTAEAGVEEGLYQYLATPSYSGGNLPFLNNISADSISVIANDWPNVKIKASAGNNLTNREIAYIINAFPEAIAFNYVIFSEGNISLDGSAIINGDVLANSNIPAPKIDNDVAGADGISFTAAGTAQTYLQNKNQSGIVFIKDVGLTSIQGASTNLQGSLVTKGSLKLSGGTYTATNNYSALVVERNLTIDGGVTINGIIYVIGSISITGSNTINGTIISANGASIDIVGNTTVNFNPAAVTNWRDLKGLVKTSALAPEIISWSEN